MKKMIIKLTTLFSLILAALLLSPSSYAAEEPVSTGYLNNSAIGKHDVLSYHQDKSAKKGSKTYIHNWKGADWHFTSESHRDLFAENPEKFSPAYNGFCSNALTLGEGLIRTNGQVWHIWNGQLHTFYAERGRERWMNGDYESLNKQAAAAWKEELAKFKK